ncbi:WXG100 family type VII secretion target [Nocardia tenerifensis]|uniref:ESAT-6-like protein n=1 Tax=Nocardia tenerifensis TaxID=228006 RepID=A0A318JUD1_9NOCA|nr:WXG100 family type VII secretion target [Nocardia tenerifensis]PXX56559.1 WXG100 family type VII secretion target [Nocardia tenerifensis]
MAHQILQVGLAQLRRGASRFAEHHGDLSGVMADIHRGHDRLQDTWSGASADAIHEVWDALHPRVRAHIDRITTHAEHLNSAATTYQSIDSDNASDIGGTAAQRKV